MLYNMSLRSAMFAALKWKIQYGLWPKNVVHLWYRWTRSWIVHVNAMEWILTFQILDDCYHAETWRLFWSFIHESKDKHVNFMCGLQGWTFSEGVLFVKRFKQRDVWYINRLHSTVIYTRLINHSLQNWFQCQNIAFNQWFHQHQ